MEADGPTYLDQIDHREYQRVSPAGPFLRVRANVCAALACTPYCLSNPLLSWWMDVGCSQKAVRHGFAFSVPFFSSKERVLSYEAQRLDA